MTDTHLSPLRLGRITGSMVGAILGLSPWQTPDDALRAMVREWHGAPPEFTGNIATEYGKRHEPLAKMAFLAKTGNLIEDCGFIIHPEHDWLGATPDGLVGLDGVAEIKCPFGLRKDLEPNFKTAAEQPHYYAQMQVEMHCTGRELCHFYQWTPHGDALEIVRISEEWWDANLPKLVAFYKRFMDSVGNPEPFLAQLRTPLDGDHTAKLLAEWDECKAAIDDAEARKKEILAELVALAGEKDAEVHGRKLTRVERKGAVDYGRVPELNGLDLEPYRKAGSEFWKLS